MTNQVIPAQAVEAACEQLNEAGVYVSPKYMRAALEAAAPHMLAADRAVTVRHLLKGMEAWAGDKELGFMEGALEAAEEAARPTR